MKKQIVSFELPLLIDGDNSESLVENYRLIRRIIGKSVNIWYEELFGINTYVGVVFDKKHKPLSCDIIELLIKDDYLDLLECVDITYNGEIISTDEIRVITQNIDLENKIKGKSKDNKLKKI